jgi:hypothetical protein
MSIEMNWDYLMSDKTIRSREMETACYEGHLKVIKYFVSRNCSFSQTHDAIVARQQHVHIADYLLSLRHRSVPYEIDPRFYFQVYAWAYQRMFVIKQIIYKSRHTHLPEDVWDIILEYVSPLTQRLWKNLTPKLDTIIISKQRKG